MDTSKIKEGDEFGSWKELCRAVNEIPKTNGNSLKYQQNDFKRFFEYNKNGKKIKITMIRDEPLDKVPSRYNPQRDILEVLVLNLLMSNQEGSVDIGTTLLMRTLSLINSKYSEIRYKMDDISNIMKVDKLNIQEWYALNNAQLKYVVESSLNSLADKSLIFWNKSVTLIHKNGDCQIADDEDMQYILEFEKDALDELGLVSKKEVYKLNRVNDFSRIIRRRLEEEYNIIGYFNSYHIVYNNDGNLPLEKARIIYKLKQSEEIEKQYQLNNITISNINENAFRRYERAMATELDIIDDPMLIMRRSDNYLDTSNRLTDKFIKKE